MAGRVLAATTLGASRTELREYPFPEIAPDAGVLKIEAAGVYGSDWQAYPAGSSRAHHGPRKSRPYLSHRAGGVALLEIARRRPRRARGVRAVTAIATFATVANSGCARNLKRYSDGSDGVMGVDVSIDTASGPATLASAMKLTRKNGAVLFAAAPPGTSEGFNVNDLLARRLTLKPCRGHSYEAVEFALHYIASKRLPLHRWRRIGSDWRMSIWRYDR